ncbi:MAG: hypothetical protein K2P95_06000 [Hyphomonadaceae bacterium]|nr:hypothetical protein [Hyphomonadaceae bacterium]
MTVRYREQVRAEWLDRWEKLSAWRRRRVHVGSETVRLQPGWTSAGGVQMNGYGASRRGTSKGLPSAAVFAIFLPLSACGTVSVVEQPLGAIASKNADIEAVVRQAQAAIQQAIEAGWGEAQRQSGLADVLLNGMQAQAGAEDAVGAYLIRAARSNANASVAIRRDLREAEDAVVAVSETLAKALRGKNDPARVREALLPTLERTLIVYRRGAALFEAADARLQEQGERAPIDLSGFDAMLDKLAGQVDLVAQTAPGG